MFTDTEILLAADRFEIRTSKEGMRLRLADTFMPEQTELVSIGECLVQVRRALSKGHKVFIEVSPHGSSNLPTAAGA